MARRDDLRGTAVGMNSARLAIRVTCKAIDKSERDRAALTSMPCGHPLSQPGKSGDRWLTCVVSNADRTKATNYSLKVMATEACYLP